MAQQKSATRAPPHLLKVKLEFSKGLAAIAPPRLVLKLERRHSSFLNLQVRDKRVIRNFDKTVPQFHTQAIRVENRRMNDHSDTLILFPLGIAAFIGIVTSVGLYHQGRRLVVLLKKRGLKMRFDYSTTFPIEVGIDPQRIAAKGHPFKIENWVALFYLFSNLDEDFPEIRIKKRTLLVGIAVASTAFLMLFMTVGCVVVYAFLFTIH